jgi:hypothetical protein
MLEENMKYLATTTFLLALALFSAPQAHAQATRIICGGTSNIPSGFVVIAENIAPAPPCGSGNRWEVEQYTTEANGSTIQFCEPATGLPNGWFVISFTTSTNCSSETNATMVMERVDGFAAGTVLNICAIGLNSGTLEFQQDWRVINTATDASTCNPNNGSAPPYGWFVRAQ